MLGCGADRIRGEYRLRKLILLLVAVVVALLLVTPRVVGALAQRQVNDYVAGFNAEAVTRSGPQITEHSYERGWFDARSSQRIALSAGSDDTPFFLIIDSQVEHGLVLDGSGFGLAEIHSGFSLVDEYERVELPLQAVTRIHLNGSASSFVSGKAIDHRFDESGSRLQWDGGELRFEVGPDGTSITANGNAGRLQFVEEENRFTFGPMRFAGDQRLSEHQFWVGASSLSVDELDLEDPAAGSFQVRNFAFEADVRLDRERLAYDLVVDADHIATPGFDGGSLHIDVALTDFHAETAARLRDKIAQQPDPVAASEPDWAEIEADLLALLARGGKLDVEKIFFATGNGRLDASAQMVIDQDVGAAMLGELLMALRGEMDIVVSKTLLATAAENNPQLAQATTMLYRAGYLLEEDDDFVLKAAYSGGLLTINGLPLPLPLPLPTR